MMTTTNSMMTADRYQIVHDEELNKICGGTVKELEQLVSALSENPTLSKMGGFCTHIPGSNQAVAATIGVFLEAELGIHAYIDLGYAGLGIGSGHNAYIENSTGNHLTHAEVVQRIRDY